jgi:hypothetical protein
MNLVALILSLLTCGLVHAQIPTPATAVTASVAFTQGVGAQTIDRSQRYGNVITITNTTPAAATFTCAVTNICTQTAHGFLTGLVMQVSNSGGALPTGLSTSTNYYAIPLTANTFSFASSLANAKAGTAVTITGTGSGTQTSTPTTLSATAALAVGNDGTIYVALPIKATGDATNSATVATGSIYLSEDNLVANYMEVLYTVTAGQFTVSQVARTKQEPRY